MTVKWDVPLLDGYPHTFVPNRSASPGTHHFGGLDSPFLVPSVLAWRPDAVLVFGWAWKSHLRALCALRGRVPVLFRGDSTLIDERPGLRAWARRSWLRWVYRRVDVALYVGKHNRAYFEAHGVRGDRLQWAPHAIENDRFADPDGVRAAEARTWRLRLGIPDDAVTVLFAGKLERKKAPDILLDAFLDPAGPNAHLIFAGSGPMEESLRERAAGAARIHFLGFQNQSVMPVAYRLGDVMVLPSRGPGETWGLAVNEAMACGLPIVVSDRVGCAPDLVRPGENGFSVSAGEAEPLREILVRLVRDAGSRARMGAASAEIIQNWTMDALAVRIEEAVLRLDQREARNSLAPPARLPRGA
jgi:glycosyltransferase involved in cell wall biosynthesis